MIDRRAFIGSLAIEVLAEPRVVRAQPSRKIPRIGLLNASAPTSIMIGPEPKSWVTIALLRRIARARLRVWRDFVTEPRGGEGKPERYPELVADLVRLQVDVIVSGGGTLGPAQAGNLDDPCRNGGRGDPVGGGFVQSLGHPDGNFTGLSNQRLKTIGKQLELLKELVPGGERWASSRGPSKRRRAPGPVVSSCSQPRSSSRTPGESRSWPPGAGCRPCTNCGRMSTPAG